MHGCDLGNNNYSCISLGEVHRRIESEEIWDEWEALNNYLWTF